MRPQLRLSLRSEHWTAWLLTQGILRWRLSRVDQVVERNADSVPAPRARRGDSILGMDTIGWLILVVIVLVVAVVAFVVIRRRRRGGGVIATKDKG
jgi:hypothetical protein